MDIEMPPAFPDTEFRAFHRSATSFFPALTSEEALFDRQKKRWHFDSSWQAVRYRYRSCAECQDEFKALLANASEAWRAGWPDEELTYQLERCICMFFMCGLSVFDSFAFSLYFVGHAIQPGTFSAVANPRNITRTATAEAYSKAFARAKITGLLTDLPADPGFSALASVRNLVGHRIAGRRSIAELGTTHADGMRTEWHQETWAAGKLTFEPEMLRRHLDDITRLLTGLASAAYELVQNHQPAP